MSRTLPKFETACRLGVAALLLFAAAAGLAQEDRRDDGQGPGAGTIRSDRSGNGNVAPANGAAGVGNPQRGDGDRGRGAGGGSEHAGDGNSAGLDTGPPDGAMKKGGAQTGHGPIDPVVGAKGGGADHGGIDLVRPDDGFGNYANLRRRAARRALIALAPIRPLSAPKLIRTAPGIGGGSGSRSGSELIRNALGIATGVEGGRHAPEFMLRGSAGSSASVGMPPGTAIHPAPPHRVDPPALDGRMMSGINGSTMGHAASGGIGGPAKFQGGINGTNFRRNF